jgi:FkbM family methyltransferase
VSGPRWFAPRSLRRFRAKVRRKYRVWKWGDYLYLDGKRLHRRFAVMSEPIVHWIADGNYELPERLLIQLMVERGYLRAGDRVIEAGAGIGVIAMQIADTVGDEGVFCFEPSPRTAEALRANFELNGHKIALKTAALVGADVRTVTFTEFPDNFVLSGTHVSSPHGVTTTVAAEPLAEAIAAIDATVLVLDVEGAEADLIASIEKWGRVHAIAMELHPRLLSEAKIAGIGEKLRAAGFLEVATPEYARKMFALFCRARAN